MQHRDVVRTLDAHEDAAHPGADAVVGSRIEKTFDSLIADAQRLYLWQRVVQRVGEAAGGIQRQHAVGTVKTTRFEDTRCRVRASTAGAGKQFADERAQLTLGDLEASEFDHRIVRGIDRRENEILACRRTKAVGRGDADQQVAGKTRRGAGEGPGGRIETQPRRQSVTVGHRGTIGETIADISVGERARRQGMGEREADLGPRPG